MNGCQIATAPDNFQDLLVKVQNEHERKIDELRAIIAELRGQVYVTDKHKDDSTVCEGPRALLQVLNLPASQCKDPRPNDSSEFLEENEEHLNAVPNSPGNSKEKPFCLNSSYTVMPVSSGVWGVELDHEVARNPSKYNSMGQKLQSSKSFLDLARFTSLRQLLWHANLHPNSTFRTFWDYVSIILVGYDVVSIPLLISFEPEQSRLGLGLAWFTLVFWTFDMGVSCFTSYFHAGKLVTSRRIIVKTYLKTWFSIDCIVVIPDWYLKLLSGSSVNQVGYIGRFLRIVRALRLLRLLKLQRLFTKIFDLIDSDYSFLVFGLFRLLLVILVLNHFVACTWYGLGAITKATHYEKNWLDDVGLSPVSGTSLAWQYTTSLHWAITQFTPASMDVYATNIVERIFSVVVLFWALLAVSSIIASITASMTALRNLGDQPMRQLWMLRRYFKEKRISPQFQERVVKYLEWQQKKNKDLVQAEQVVLLKKISPALKMELSAELGAPVILPHPLFNYLFDYSVGLRQMCIKICDCALKFTPLGEKDSPFESEHEAVAMYFIKSGLFDYIIEDEIYSQPSVNSWVSEAALWTTWQHRGTLTACQPGELCSVSPAPFAQVLRLHPRTFHLGANYGAKFVDFLNSKATELTDIISADCDAFSDVAAYDSYITQKRANATNKE